MIGQSARSCEYCGEDYPGEAVRIEVLGVAAIVCPLCSGSWVACGREHERMRNWLLERPAYVE